MKKITRRRAQQLIEDYETAYNLFEQLNDFLLYGSDFSNHLEKDRVANSLEELEEILEELLYSIRKEITNSLESK